MMANFRVLLPQSWIPNSVVFHQRLRRPRCSGIASLRRKTRLRTRTSEKGIQFVGRVMATRMNARETKMDLPAAPIFLPKGDWIPIEGGVTAPMGFQASSVSANLRSSPGKEDVALLLCPTGATVAGVFTKNLLCAAPVLYDKALLQRTSVIKAVLTNAGQANAATGPAGLVDAQDSASALTQHLSIKPDDILVLSTGVIGHRIRMENLLESLDTLTGSLDSGVTVDQAFATAITTTDLAYKTTAVELEIEGKRVRVGGVCKGSGMINPNMATLLGVITCDANVTSSVWKRMLTSAVNLSFNRLTVDGDTSTNDTILALTSGLSEASIITDETSHSGLKLQAALTAVCQGLAKSVAWDGEGATCLMEVIVKGAQTDDAAGVIAKSIANSSLTKAAVFGHDPNWGRIAAAAGYAGVDFCIDDLDITFGEIPLMQKGVPVDFDKVNASTYLKDQCANRSIVRIEVRVGQSKGEATVWGCDLSYDYVRINAEYTT